MEVTAFDAVDDYTMPVDWAGDHFYAEIGGNFDYGVFRYGFKNGADIELSPSYSTLAEFQFNTVTKANYYLDPNNTGAYSIGKKQNTAISGSYYGGYGYKRTYQNGRHSSVHSVGALGVVGYERAYDANGVSSNFAGINFSPGVGIGYGVSFGLKLGFKW